MRNLKLKARIVELFGTQIDFAEEIGVDRSIVSRVVNSRRSVPEKSQDLWCRALKCDPSLLSPIKGRRRAE